MIAASARCASTGQATVPDLAVDETIRPMTNWHPITERSAASPRQPWPPRPRGMSPIIRQRRKPVELRAVPGATAAHVFCVEITPGVGMVANLLRSPCWIEPACLKARSKSFGT